MIVRLLAVGGPLDGRVLDGSGEKPKFMIEDRPKRERPVNGRCRWDDRVRWYVRDDSAGVDEQLSLGGLR